MKKVLFSLLAVAMVFVGCKPKQNEVTEVTSLILDKTSLVLTVGGAPQKLTATVEPSTATVTWETSNEAIATVAGGLVTPVAAGNCVITAKAGEKTATCSVLVEEEGTEEYVWQFGGVGIFDLEAIEGADTIDLELSDGVYRCVPANALLYIWGSGLTFVSGTGFQGADYIFECLSKVYMIAEGTYSGYYVGSADGFKIEDSEEFYAIAPGKVAENYPNAFLDLLNSPEDATDEEVDALYEAWINAISGAYALPFYDGNMHYPFEALLTAGQIDWDSNGDYYDITINWFDYSETAQYGIKGEIVIDGTDTTFVYTEPYEMQYVEQHVQNYDFSAEPEAEVKQQYKIINPALIHSEMPVIKIGDNKSFRRK